MNKLQKKVMETALVSISVAMPIYVVSMLYVKDPGIRSIAYFISIIVGLLPPFIVQMNEYMKMKSIEENFPLFLSDIAENVKSGMTLVKAIKILSGKTYGKLTPYVNKVISKIDWGVSFEDVMSSMSTGNRQPRDNKIHQNAG